MALGIWLRSLLFFLLYNLLGIGHSLVSLAVAPFMPFERRHRFVNLWSRGTMWLLRHVNGIEIDVVGGNRIPRDEALVVMANHQSQWETFFLQLLISPQVTVLKRELLWLPFFGWALALTRPIAIDRSKPVNAMKALLRQGKRRLDEGISVLIFPEGTRQPPGAIGRLNAGGAKLACDAGRRVLPIVHNAGDCWPARSLLRRPGRIRVVIGEPLECEGGPSELMERIDAWMRSTSAGLGRSATARGEDEPLSLH